MHDHILQPSRAPALSRAHGEKNTHHPHELNRSPKTALMQDLLTGRKRVTGLLTTEEDQP